MKIVDKTAERDRQEREKKGRFEGVCSLADKVFGRERVECSGRKIVGSDPYRSIYVDFVHQSGPINCSVEIEVGHGVEVRVHNEESYSEARRFGEEVEGRLKEEVILNHNYPRNH